MAGTFIAGEKKARPGAYFNIQRKSETASDVMEGVTIVIFKSDFGPLNTAVELSAEDGYEGTFGTGMTTDAIKEAIAGGAKTIIACRVGSGGTKGTVALKDTNDEDVLTITARYPGDKEFFVTVRNKLINPSFKECIFYAGITELEKITFEAGNGEAGALADALASSKNFNAELAAGKKEAELATVLQCAFNKGTNPQTTVEDYSNAFTKVEPYEANTICVDTENTEVHILLQSFLNRIFDAGSLMQAVIAECHTVDLEIRKEHAEAFNDEKMNYVLNAHIRKQGRNKTQSEEIDGYQTAARIAGMIGAAKSNVSLTHTIVTGYTEILENLSNTEIASAEKRGCIVLSYNKAKQVWIDNAINTLVVPAENQDDGWKKIRRVKTRFELIRRINNITDELAGKVDNDTNGKATVISQIQSVGDAMKEEGKLVSCVVTESNTDMADVDSAWFYIDIIDKDSMEHIYLTFFFQFNTSI